MSAPRTPGPADAGANAPSVQWVPASAWTNFAPVTEVHGVCFDEHGAILLLSPDGAKSWRLPGGQAVPNEAWRTTLLRAAREQAGVELGELTLLGAFAVTAAGRAPSFQLRCAGHVHKLDEVRPDPGTGTAFARRMVPSAEFMDVVASEAARPMLAAALRWAEKHPFGKPAHPSQAPGAIGPGGGKSVLPGSRGSTPGLTARGGSAAPRPRRRAGLG